MLPAPWASDNNGQTSGFPLVGKGTLAHTDSNVNSAGSYMQVLLLTLRKVTKLVNLGVG